MKRGMYVGQCTVELGTICAKKRPKKGCVGMSTEAKLVRWSIQMFHFADPPSRPSFTALLTSRRAAELGPFENKLAGTICFQVLGKLIEGFKWFPTEASNMLRASTPRPAVEKRGRIQGCRTTSDSGVRGTHRSFIIAIIGSTPNFCHGQRRDVRLGMVCWVHGQRRHRPGPARSFGARVHPPR